MFKWLASFFMFFGTPAEAQTAEFLSLNSKIVNETRVLEILWFVDDQETLNDILCLAANIYHEARGSTLKDQIASAHVVMNRIKDRRWSDNVCQVVWEPYQFSWTNDGKSDIPREEKAWEVAQTVAYKVFFDVYDDITNGSNHYHGVTVRPDWSKEVSFKKRIGGHYYYKL